MTETKLNKTPGQSADLGEEALKAMAARCEDIAECGHNPDSKDPLEDVLKAVKGAEYERD